MIAFVLFLALDFLATCLAHCDSGIGEVSSCSQPLKQEHDQIALLQVANDLLPGSTRKFKTPRDFLKEKPVKLTSLSSEAELLDPGVFPEAAQIPLLAQPPVQELLSGVMQPRQADPSPGFDAGKTISDALDVYMSTNQADANRVKGYYDPNDVKNVGKALQSLHDQSMQNLPAAVVISGAMGSNQGMPPSVIYGALSGETPMEIEAHLAKELGATGPLKPAQGSPPDSWRKGPKGMTPVSPPAIVGDNPYYQIQASMDSNQPQMFPIQPRRGILSKHQVKIATAAHKATSETILAGFLRSLPPKPAANNANPQVCAEQLQDLAKGQGNGRYWKCADGGECIDQAGRCDGAPNCKDSSDELFCHRGLGGRVVSLEAKHSDLQDEVLGLRSSGAGREAEFNSLNVQLRTLNESLATDFSSLRKRLGPYNNLTSELDTIKNNTIDLQNNFTSFKSHDDDRAKDAQALNSQNSALETAISDVKHQNGVLKKQVKALREDYVQLQIHAR